MHKSECIQEDRMLKIRWDFEIETDSLNIARKPDLKSR